MTKPRLRSLLLVGAASASISLALDATGNQFGMSQLEDFTLDLRQQTTPEGHDPEREVVLVLFDEVSVNDPVTGWPWTTPFPRSLIAETIRGLSRAGARTIGLNVVLDRLLPQLNEIDQGDDLLRAAMDEAGNVVLVAPIQRVDPEVTLVEPHPHFAEVAASVGVAEIPLSLGTVRYGTLAVGIGGELAPSFALALYAHAKGLAVDSLLGAARDSGRVDLPGLPQELGHIERRGSGELDGTLVPFPIHYLGPPSSVNADDPPGVFQSSASGTVPEIATFLPDLFRDKIVLLGTGFHSDERFRTPFFGFRHPDSDDQYFWTYGVEIHATVLQNMLDEEYVDSVAWWAVALVTLAAGLLAAATFWWGTLAGVLASPIVLTAALAPAWWAWAGTIYMPFAVSWSVAEPYLVLPVAPPMLAVGLGVVGCLGMSAGRHASHQNARRKLAGYVGEHEAKLLTGALDLTQGGLIERDITVLFSDLVGYSRISAQLEPGQLASLLSEYIREMTDLIHEHGGTFDKSVGDAIMAFWNAPSQQKDHAERAFRCAQRMRERTRALVEGWSAEMDGVEGLDVRIGINTGPAAVGSLGRAERFEFTAVGNAVNVASRLEALADPGEIVLSKMALGLMPSVEAEDMGDRALKNIPDPVHCYSVRA